jgi:aryl-alcohol dehydrogenase-like predicted oxidoreductase
VERLRDFFRPQGRSLAQVALAWVLGRPGITSAILGASHAKQLSETLPAVDLKLTDQEVAFCDQIWYGLPRSADRQEP